MTDSRSQLTVYMGPAALESGSATSVPGGITVSVRPGGQVRYNDPPPPNPPPRTPIAGISSYRHSEIKGPRAAIFWYGVSMLAILLAVDFWGYG
jgi:hypothetical protein